MKPLVEAISLIAPLIIMSCPAHAATFDIVLAGGVRLTVTESPFVAGNRVIEGCGTGMACRIDRREAVAAIGMPKSALAEVRVTIDGATYRLDSTGAYNPLLDKDLGRTWGVFCYDSENRTIRAALGDAGGSYGVEWIVRHGVPSRTILTNSGDVVRFLRSHLIAEHYE